MSGKDKTQEKLIASIRKTQQDSTIKNKGEQVKAKSSVKYPIAKARPVKPGTVKFMTAKKSKYPGNKKISPQNNSDNYQSANRVWPD